MSTTSASRRRSRAALTAAAVLGGSALLGTFALYHDVEVVRDNDFTSGVLDIGLEDQEFHFTAAGMAPGDEVLDRVRVVNQGTVPMFWNTSVTVAEGAEMATRLATATYPVDDATACTAQALVDVDPMIAKDGFAGVGDVAGPSTARVLDVGEHQDLCLRVGFDRDATAALSGTAANLTWVFDGSQMTQPPAPEHLRVLSTAGTTSVIEWEPVPTAESYEVDGALTADIAGTSAVVTTPGGQTTDLRVRSLNRVATSDWSAPTQVTGQLATPQDLQSTTEGSSVTISWPAVAGAERYELDGAAGATIDGTSATFTGAPGTRASVRVRAVNAAGASEWSEPVEVAFDLDKVTGLRVVSAQGASDVVLTWDAVPFATGYLVDGTGAPEPVATTDTTLSFAAAPGTALDLSVRATLGDLVGAATQPVRTGVATTAPNGLRVTKVEGTIVSVAWDASPNATGYDLNGAASGVTYDGTSATFTGTPGDTYTLTVTASSPGGTSTASSPATATLAPPTPTGVAASVSGTTVTVSWNPSNGATSYLIGGFGGEITYAGTTATFSGVPGATYTSLAVGAVNAGGMSNASAPAGAVSVAPAAPTGVIAVVNGQTVNVSWSASSGATSYVLTGGNGTITYAGPSATFTGTAGETYALQVRAVNAGGQGAPSAPATATIAPPVPTGLAATQTSEGWGVDTWWNAANGATSYELVGYDERGTPYYYDGTRASFDAMPGTTYTLQVRAVNAGGKSALSPAVAVTTQPMTPATPTASVSGNTITVEWGAVKGATSYAVTGANDSLVVGANSATFTAVPGTTYSIRVAARNTGGTSAPSDAVEVVVPNTMTMTYKTTTANAVVELPIYGVTTAGTIDWGDGTVEPLTTEYRPSIQPGPSHTFTAAGTYTVSVNASFDTFGKSSRALGVEYLTAVTRWDDGTGTVDLFNAFLYATTLQSVVEPPPTVTSLSGTFQKATSFNGDISGWDTSNITQMSNTFNGATAFNQPIGSWNTSKVTTMTGMFTSAAAFNQPIGSWDTSKVTSMTGMFTSATSFNRPLSTWDTSNVTSLTMTFMGATSFNQSLSSWNTAKVTSLMGTFSNATAFNGSLAGWNTANVTNMSDTFNGATVFNQPLSTWNTGKVTTLMSTFANAKAFNSSLAGWSTANVTNMSDTFNGAIVFNQAIGSWDTAKATNMSRTFTGAAKFNQNLSGWNVAKVTSHDMFDSSATAWVLARPTFPS
ncbi:hypothetical protein CHO01_22160 [Cellulomonas hominis]|uniref:Surface protein n=1 Tax=Cellulomonas hominis TaxID=156981 RepID=A0A511FCW6_9CELL|nr:TasA family protein [Cellulomonas hominis]MBB5474660.1 surface protein [Cellulomonas hominis]NKY05785.1 BspA family leucine-rich repeat surface protein [Cellulomonas hominis]GEL47100.1 hypothetical protein CHO01_22160 [Cellulomonas hominis]